MPRRDSDSKRRHSRFDRQPSYSPKRYRRDGKRERDRVTTRANAENGDHRRHRQLPDAVPLSHEAPLPHHSTPQAVDLHNDTDNKPIDHYDHEAPKHAPDPTQRDEQGSAGQDGRSSGQRKAGERGWWKDIKNQHNEREGQGREQRDEKSQAKPEDDTSRRRSGFSERKVYPPPASRKRPVFREKKIPVDSGDANPAATVTIMSSQIDHPPEKNERKEERSSNPYHLGRPEKQFADDRAPNKDEARRDGFPSRERYRGNANGGIGGNDNYRGRDKLIGRQGFRPIKTQTEKWKHDLYQEVNKDPIPQNEDDKIAKLEALLAS